MARSKNTSPTETTGVTVVGLFQDQPTAEAAIRRLIDAGFKEQDIGVAVRDRAQQDEITEETGTQAAEGAKTGAVSGGVVGGVVGLLAGVGALVIPGIGPIIAGGALASTLAGAGIGAAAGGLLGALVGLGIPEENARHFEQGFQQGGILLTVSAGGRADEAREILDDSGADLGPAEVSYDASAGYAGIAGDDRDLQDDERLELKEEQLDVDTRQVEAGEVRVRKEVVTEQRNIEVPVTREEVVIERHAVSGREASDRTIGDEDEIRIPLTEEEVDVKKRAVVREEVSVSKRPVQETRTVSENVRREEARIEAEGDVDVRSAQNTERRRGRSRSYTGPERRVASAR